MTAPTPSIQGALFGIENGALVTYTRAHDRMRRLRGPAHRHVCVGCGQPAQQWAYDHMDPNEMTCLVKGVRFSADPKHYEPRCIKCHVRFDNPSRFANPSKQPTVS